MNQVQLIETCGADTANTRSTVLTGAATAHVKGAYASIIAATARVYNGLLVVPHVLGGTNISDALIDVAIGVTSSEQIIIPNLYVSAVSISAFTYYDLPGFHIPAGVQISARCQTNIVSGTVRCGIFGLTYGFHDGPQLGLLTAYGVDTTDSGGTSVDPGATINTKGAWVVVTPSTSKFHRGFILGIGGQLNTARTTCSWLIDVAIGATGSEQVILANFPARANSTANTIFPNNLPFIPMPIPAGTQLQVRASCTINDASDRLLDAMIWGAS